MNERLEHHFVVCGREMNGGTHQHLVVVVEVVAGHAGVRVLVNDGLGLQSVPPHPGGRCNRNVPHPGGM